MYMYVLAYSTYIAHLDMVHVLISEYTYRAISAQIQKLLLTKSTSDRGNSHEHSAVSTSALRNYSVSMFVCTYVCMYIIF